MPDVIFPAATPGGSDSEKLLRWTGHAYPAGSSRISPESSISSETTLGLLWSHVALVGLQLPTVAKAGFQLLISCLCLSSARMFRAMPG